MKEGAVFEPPRDGGLVRFTAKTSIWLVYQLERSKCLVKCFDFLGWKVVADL